MANGKPVLKFIESWHEPGGVFVASFRPATDFEWRGGQFVQVEMPDLAEDPRQGRRALSIASYPNERFVLLATVEAHGEAPSPFKEALASLQAGDEVHVNPPRGTFTLADDPEATHVCLALGIGATAIRSLAYDTATTLLEAPVRVVQTPVEDGYPFENDLRNLAKSYDNAHYERTPSPPTSREALEEAAGGTLEGARFYVAGPPDDVTAVREALRDAGVPDERVRFEMFAGYD